MQKLVVKHNVEIVENLEDVRKSIEAEVAKYDVIITEDMLPEAKKMMADLNKGKKEFSTQCKKFLDIVSEPIIKFKEEQKKIESIFTDGRSKIESQVKKYEAKKLEEVKSTVQEYIDGLCKMKDIDPSLVPVEPYVLLGSVTSKGNISKATKDKIDAVIAMIENEKLKAKLEAEEKAKRDAKIAEEAVQRERERAEREKQLAIEQARADERKRIEAEAKRKADEEAKLKLDEIKKQSDNIKQKIAEKPKPVSEEDFNESGKTMRETTVLAEFVITAKKNISKESIVHGLREKLGKEFKSFTMIRSSSSKLV